MSSVLKKNKLFLKNLLDRNTPLNQKRAIIYTASDRQLSAVAEIVFNVGAGVIPLPKTARILLKKYRLFIEKANRLKGKARSKLLTERYKQVCDILLSVGKIVLEIIA
ncbi:MAG: hypothetical protein N0E59_23445 [Candidatus Thiodiazotropha taylori]|nr:hypothetical protein [Candidatus Thiodiazotropha taylori]MCG8113716.1 hypothetical protein [Candidatus Thiodiazotropha taylori]MCW4286076.1 hypothetical protein [Candidatus Thiodiazotropha taylori]MCW4333924.1 hypothetical protein [Candidatus Thiodiazotropha endolucinida]